MLLPPVDRSFRMSFFATLLAPLPVLLMIYLVETHTQGESMLARDIYPAHQVIICMLLASIISVIAIVTSIGPILNRRLLPLFLVVALLSSWAFFLQWYDWKGLFDNGKAWASSENAKTTVLLVHF